ERRNSKPAAFFDKILHGEFRPKGISFTQLSNTATCFIARPLRLGFAYYRAVWGSLPKNGFQKVSIKSEPFLTGLFSETSYHFCWPIEMDGHGFSLPFIRHFTLGTGFLSRAGGSLLKLERCPVVGHSFPFLRSPIPCASPKPHPIACRFRIGSGSFRAMRPGNCGNLGNIGNVESVTYRPHYPGDETNPPLRFCFSLNRLQGSLNQFVTKVRSEEHTSELQSRGHLVCRLLLEKKKK